MPEDELDAARSRITELEAEVGRLKAQADDGDYIRGLRSRLTHAAVAGMLAAPADHGDLLQQTVAAAINVLHASAGSLYVVDDATDELVFQVALPAQAQHLVGQRLPLGHGLAGWVAATGQAIAVADVQQDPRWAGDVALDVGYAPRTMIAAPLLIGDRVIGVIQVLDKDGGAAFGAEDMEILGQFANQGAIAIEQSQRLQSLALLFRAALTPLLGAELQRSLAGEADAFISRLESSTEYAETLELAGLLAGIARNDDAGRRMCLDVAKAMTRYLEHRSRYDL